MLVDGAKFESLIKVRKIKNKIHWGYRQGLCPMTASAFILQSFIKSL